MTYNNSYVSSTPLVTIGSKNYYFGDIFTESTMSGNCNGTQCIVSCSCKAGWTTLSTSYSTRAAASGAYVAVTAPRKYADGTPTCRKSVSCADYGYVSSISSGYYGKQVKVTTSGATLTCYATIGTCTYSCPSNYYYSGNIYGCYKAGSSAYETLNQSSYVNNCSATSSTKCYQKIYKSLADEGITSKTCTGCNVSVSNKSTCGNTYYTCRNKTLAEEGITSASSCASGQIKQQKTSPCGNTYYYCKENYFDPVSAQLRMTLKYIFVDWNIYDSSGKRIGGGSKLANKTTAEAINETYNLSPGTYIVEYLVRGWVPVKNGRPGYYCVCKDTEAGNVGSTVNRISFEITGKISAFRIPTQLPSGGHA